MVFSLPGRLLVKEARTSGSVKVSGLQVIARLDLGLDPRGMRPWEEENDDVEEGDANVEVLRLSEMSEALGARVVIVLVLGLGVRKETNVDAHGEEERHERAGDTEEDEGTSGDDSVTLMLGEAFGTAGAAPRIDNAVVNDSKETGHEEVGARDDKVEPDVVSVRRIPHDAHGRNEVPNPRENRNEKKGRIAQPELAEAYGARVGLEWLLKNVSHDCHT
jgi:hypothetical protein